MCACAVPEQTPGPDDTAAADGADNADNDDNDDDDDEDDDEPWLQPTEKVVLEGHKNEITMIEFNNEGHAFATASKDGSVRVRLSCMVEPVCGVHVQTIDSPRCHRQRWANEPLDDHTTISLSHLAWHFMCWNFFPVLTCSHQASGFNPVLYLVSSNWVMPLQLLLPSSQLMLLHRALSPPLQVVSLVVLPNTTTSTPQTILLPT